MQQTFQSLDGDRRKRVADPRAGIGRQAGGGTAS
jgi:hypothetical protein